MPERERPSSGEEREPVFTFTAEQRAQIAAAYMQTLDRDETERLSSFRQPREERVSRSELIQNSYMPLIRSSEIPTFETPFSRDRREDPWGVFSSHSGQLVTEPVVSPEIRTPMLSSEEQVSADAEFIGRVRRAIDSAPAQVENGVVVYGERPSAEAVEAVTVDDIEAFIQSSISDQFRAISSALRSETRPVPWEKIRHYCLSQVKYEVDLHTFGVDEWKPKLDDEVVMKLFGRMRADQTPEVAEEFLQFLTWVATGPDVSENTRRWVVRELEREWESNAGGVIRSVDAQDLFAILAPQVDADWDAYESERTPPTYASRLLTAISGFREYVDASDQIRFAKAKQLAPIAEYFHTYNGVYIQATHAVDQMDIVDRYPQQFTPYMRLYTLRRYLDYRASGVFIPPEDMNLMATAELDSILSKANRAESEQKNALRPTVGCEFQYEGDERVGIHEDDLVDIGRVKRGKTKFAKDNIRRLAHYALVEFSGDPHYEFVIAPSYAAETQVLIFSELERIQHHFVGRETPLEVGIHINLGGIRFDTTKCTELQDLQMMMLTTGLGFAVHEFSSNQSAVTWGSVNPDRWGSELTYKGGTMVYQRLIREDESSDCDARSNVGQKPARFVSEQRMFTSYSFSEAVRLIRRNQDLAMMVKAHQRVGLKCKVSPYELELSALWQEMHDRAEKVYLSHGFDLNRIIYEPDHRQSFGITLKHALADGGPLVSDMQELLREYQQKALAVERAYLASKGHG